MSKRRRTSSGSAEPVLMLTGSPDPHWRPAIPSPSADGAAASAAALGAHALRRSASVSSSGSPGGLPRSGSVDELGLWSPEAAAFSTYLSASDSGVDMCGSPTPPRSSTRLSLCVSDDAIMDESPASSQSSQSSESSRSSCSSAEIDVLPDELVLAIFAWLPYSCTEMCRLRFVSPRWRTLLADMSTMRGRPLYSPFADFRRMLRVQERHVIREDYLGPVGLQTQVTANMRAIVVDWLVTIAPAFHLSDDTVPLTVVLFDRYLSRTETVVSRGRLQLVAVAALLIAAKMEDIYPPLVEQLVYITDDTYDRTSILTMESLLFTTLHGDLRSLTVRHFSQYFLSKAATSFVASAAAVRDLGHATAFLAELSMLDYPLVRKSPSLVGLSTVCLALHWAGLKPWTLVLQPDVAMHHTADEVVVCVEHIRKLLADYQQSQNGGAPEPCLPAIHSKYADAAFGAVSTRSVPAPLTRDDA
eukprot:TRINITY_DN11606_c0_g1_i1.p1 TRINITY_DN11606_c0_g1~~TRINITY_DN11606_c0_g1_i1.p1  ORF type:complete len:473 (-),score=131.54 TRINITY_DN11606_c0_g1_i1:326-1744(-)